MTVFRVNVDRDAPLIVKRIKDPAVEKAGKIFFKELLEIRSKFWEIDRLGSKALKRSRDVYKICDKALKKKDISKQDKEDLLGLRKLSYEFSNELKKLGIK